MKRWLMSTLMLGALACWAAGCTSETTDDGEPDGNGGGDPTNGCQDACTLNLVRCAGDDVERCVMGDDDCTEWVNVAGKCDDPGDDDTYVASFLAVADFGEGFDLNGDGDPDNTAGSLLNAVAGQGFDANAELVKALQQGDIILLMSTDGVQNYGTDDSLSLNFVIGQDPQDTGQCDPLESDEAATCTGDPPESQPSTECCEETLAADNYSGNSGVDFCVDPQSYEEGTTTPRIIFSNAHIAGGTLFAGPSLFVFDVPMEDMILSLRIESAQVMGSIEKDIGIGYRDDNSDSEANDALIGGAIPAVALLEALTAIPDIADYYDIVVSLLASFADIDLDGVPSVCDADGNPTGCCDPASEPKPEQVCCEIGQLRRVTGGAESCDMTFLEPDLCHNLDDPGICDALSVALKFTAAAGAPKGDDCPEEGGNGGT